MAPSAKRRRASAPALAVALLVLVGFACQPKPAAQREAGPSPSPSVKLSPSPSPTPAPALDLAPVSGTAIVITRGPTTGRTVLLTFDAGADRGYAPQILATLEGAGVSATFGVTGLWAEANPDLVQRMVADGDTIVNHTFDHHSFTGRSTHGAGLSAAQRLSEIEMDDAILTEVAGHSPKPWFRIPYGDSDAATDAEVAQAGYRYVLGWTVDSLGWMGLTPPAIIVRCLSKAAPGDIYLFHVGSQSQDVTALPSVIAGLRAQGYTFETAADLEAPAAA
jgi:peptidoglycan/xylan/chitin deacetylase (PgdA/CDA1 family)